VQARQRRPHRPSGVASAARPSNGCWPFREELVLMGAGGRSARQELGAGLGGSSRYDPARLFATRCRRGNRALSRLRDPRPPGSPEAAKPVRRLTAADALPGRRMPAGGANGLPQAWQAAVGSDLRTKRQSRSRGGRHRLDNDRGQTRVRRAGWAMKARDCLTAPHRHAEPGLAAPAERGWRRWGLRHVSPQAGRCGSWGERVRTRAVEEALSQETARRTRRRQCVCPG
jgi:hypothetical protein